MTEREFDTKWGHDVNADKMSYEELAEFKNDCFAMYEEEEGEHNGMKFDVLRRATTNEVDMEYMPVWEIEFENGDIAYCYPEEICKVEHKDK